MTFTGLALLAASIIAVWSAITNENPISAAGAALRGERDPGTTLLDPNPAVPAGAATNAGTTAPSTGSGGQIPMIRPHPGPTTSGYGPRPRPTAGASTYHRGFDIDGQSGDPIVAAASGVVTRSYYSSGYGNRVEIDHGDGITTTYSHMLEAQRIPQGRRVAAGELVGLMGSTGVSTGSHLHFEVIVNGEKVDPAPWIGDRGGPDDDSRNTLTRRPVPPAPGLRIAS